MASGFPMQFKETPAVRSTKRSLFPFQNVISGKVSSSQNASFPNQDLTCAPTFDVVNNDVPDCMHAEVRACQAKPQARVATAGTFDW